MSHAKGRSLPGPRTAVKFGAAFSPSYPYIISPTYFPYPMLGTEPKGTAVGIAAFHPGTIRANFSLWKNLYARVAQRPNQNSVIHCIAIQPRQEETRYILTLEFVCNT